MKLSTLTALWILCIPASAQVLQPLGSGIPAKVVASFAAGEDYLALYEETSTLEPNDYTLGHWNGLYWSFYPNLVVPEEALTSNGTYNFHSLAYYKNEIYVGANISNATKPADSFVSHLFKWGGNSWITEKGIIQSKNDGIYAMTVFDDKLIVAGQFLNSINGKIVNNIAAFDGTAWNYLGQNNVQQGTDGKIKSLLPVDNRLYIAGDFSTFAGTLTGNVAYYTKSNGGWGGIGSPYAKEVTQLANVGNTVYAYGWNLNLSPEIREYKASNWSAPVKFDSFSTADPKTIAGTSSYLLIGGDFIRNSNGTSLLRYVNAVCEVTENRITGNFILGQRGSEAFIWGNFSESNTGIKNFSRIVRDAGNVLGTVYFDKNQDCKLNVDESGMNTVMLKFTNDVQVSYFVYSNENGLFSTTLPEGFYDVQIFPGKYWSSTCASNNGVQVRNGEYSFMSLGQFIAPNLNDISVTMGSALPNNVKPGDLVKIVLFVKNTGSTIVSGPTIHFNYDARFIEFFSDPLPTNSSGTEAIYTVLNLQPRHTFQINAFLRVPLDAQAADRFLNRIHTGSLFTQSDLLKEDNFDTLLLAPLANNYSGNVYKESLIGDSINFNTNRLKYKISFCNGSKEFVKRVVLVDTMDLQMPASRFPIINYSSDIRITAKGSNILVLEFNEANLASKEGNPSQSTGFVEYDIELWKNLNHNQVVRNMAVADFDSKFQESSNVTMVKALDPKSNTTVLQGINAKIYPNPANDKLFIEFAVKPASSIAIHSISGALLMVLKTETNMLEVDISKLSAGLYMVSSDKGSAFFSVMR